MEHNNYADTGKQPERTSGTGHTDRQTGLARSSRDPLSYGGAYTEEESDNRQAEDMLVTEPKVRPLTKEEMLSKPVTVSVDDPPKLKPGHEPRPSPIFKLMSHLVAQNQELLTEQLERAEKDARRRKQNREAAKRHRQKDPEAYKARNKEEQRRSRERKKQQA